MYIYIYIWYIIGILLHQSGLWRQITLFFLLSVTLLQVLQMIKLFSLEFLRFFVRNCHSDHETVQTFHFEVQQKWTSKLERFKKIFGFHVFNTNVSRTYPAFGVQGPGELAEGRVLSTGQWVPNLFCLPCFITVHPCGYVGPTPIAYSPKTIRHSFSGLFCHINGGHRFPMIHHFLGEMIMKYDFIVIESYRDSSNFWGDLLTYRTAVRCLLRWNRAVQHQIGTFGWNQWECLQFMKSPANYGQFCQQFRIIQLLVVAW